MPACDMKDTFAALENKHKLMKKYKKYPRGQSAIQTLA
jgi:hypothetical protein